jgi:hypothetical protein
MSDSYTFTETETFSVTHARYIASKVATDLLRFTRYYSNPTLEQINKFEAELTALLKAGYLESVTYGFKRDGQWIEALRYHALLDGTLLGDDDPGKIRPGTDVPGETFSSYLIRNRRWHNLSTQERAAFEDTLPIKRADAPEPPVANGSWSHGLSYSAGGRGIGRSTIIR